MTHPSIARPGVAVAAFLTLAIVALAPVVHGAPAPTITTLALTAGGQSVTSVTTGKVVTLTATVTVGGEPVTPGLVNFCDATAKSCTDVRRLGSVQLTKTGTAVFQFRPGAGNHKYKAAFAGTTTAAASESAAVALSVTAATSQTATLTELAATGSWGQYAVTATVTETGSATPLTGNVTFRDGTQNNATLGTVKLGAAAPAMAWTQTLNQQIADSVEQLAVGDFNGDGIPDLALVIGGYNVRLQIMLGKATGAIPPWTGRACPTR
jgi:hypothetical protein